MNKKIWLIGILLIFLISCKDKEIEALREENNQLRSEMYKQTQTVYVWSVIECKVASSQDFNGKYRGIKDHLYWSEIKEFNYFDDDIKYRLQDELERDCRHNFAPGFFQSITSKNTFVFNSYAEASQFKDKVVNGIKND